jgi:hypothetical protein
MNDVIMAIIWRGMKGEMSGTWHTDTRDRRSTCEPKV